MESAGVGLGIVQALHKYRTVTAWTPEGNLTIIGRRSYWKLPTGYLDERVSSEHRSGILGFPADNLRIGYKLTFEYQLVAVAWQRHVIAKPKPCQISVDVGYSPQASRKPAMPRNLKVAASPQHLCDARITPNQTIALPDVHSREFEILPCTPWHVRDLYCAAMAFFQTTISVLSEVLFGVHQLWYWSCGRTTKSRHTDSGLNSRYFRHLFYFFFRMAS